MKKISIILLTFAMLLAFCACNNETDVRGEIKNDTSADSVSDTVSVVDTDVQTNENDATDTEAGLDFGKTEGNVYENAFIGIGCKLDEGWSFYDDEQINVLNNLAADMMPEDAQEMLKEATVVYDMFATAADAMNNINVNLEKVNAVQLIGLDLAKNFELVVPTLKATYENAGYTNFNYEITEIEIEGQTFVAMKASAEISGVNMYQLLFQKKCNGYLANVTITSYFDDATETILDTFYLVK